MSKKQKGWNLIYQKGKRFTPVNEIYLDRLLHFVEKALGRKIKTAVDLGCGTGDLAIKLAKRGIKVMGVDFSDAALKIARNEAKNKRVLPRIRFLNKDLEKLSAKQFLEKFDIAFNRLTIAFLKDKKKFLKSVRVIIKPGGVFILMTPVLLSGHHYSKHLKAISVKKSVVEKLLKTEFKKFVLFHERHFGENGIEATYILRNN